MYFARTKNRRYCLVDSAEDGAFVAVRQWHGPVVGGDHADHAD